jgi:hypothetical protein
VTGSRQYFPSLKNTVAVRMADSLRPPNLPQKLIAPPSLPAEPAAPALPTVIPSTQLRVQPQRSANDGNGAQYEYSFRSPVPHSVIALGTTFLAGMLFAYVLYVANLMPGIAKAAVPTTPPGLVWPDLLSPGVLSPRGQSAVGVTPDQAFQIADSKLHDAGVPDDDEARYWLRVGIGGTFSNDRLRWALTQLGTLYARPAASPADLAIARSAWELATAQKDPIALCFLARLEEGQSGTQPNKEVALNLFKQAKATGLCSGADQAIERLSP